MLLESPDVPEEETMKQNDIEDSAKSDYTEETSDTEEAQPTNTEEKGKNVNDNIVNTTAFCPHCGAKVRVGVVLLPEE